MNNNILKHLDAHRSYEGYVWMSNESKPHVYDNEPVDMSLFESANPFVAQAFLYDRQKLTSISIKFTDGQYFVTAHSVKPEDFQDSRVDHVRYLAHSRLCTEATGNRVLHFLRYWLPQEAPSCLGMNSLVMSKVVFVGFHIPHSADASSINK